jgi:hypothetical protein
MLAIPTIMAITSMTVLAFTVLILNRHPERPLSEPALSPAGE